MAADLGPVLVLFSSANLYASEYILCTHVSVYENTAELVLKDFKFCYIDSKIEIDGSSLCISSSGLVQALKEESRDEPYLYLCFERHIEIGILNKIFNNLYKSYTIL